MERAMLLLVSALALLSFAVGADQDCGQHELARCARPIQVLSETSDLHFVSNKEELDRLCPDLEKGLQCIHSYTRRCMDAQHRTHFKKLYRGTGEAVRDLCAPGPFQDAFLGHAPCIKGIKPHYERCAATHMHAIGQLSGGGAPNATRRDDRDAVGTFCCSFMSYLSCSERAVRDHCGQETADFTRRFLLKISDALLRSHCNEYFESPARCQAEFSGLNKSANLAPALATLLLPVVMTLAVLLQVPATNSSIAL